LDRKSYERLKMVQNCAESVCMDFFEGLWETTSCYQIDIKFNRVVLAPNLLK